MSPEAQRIAIAEACGWTKISDWKAAGINGQHPTEPWTEVIPDYLNDLNAMHEAEKFLRKPIFKSDSDSIIADRMHQYVELLGYAVDATAAQRAEAYLRTIGKWEGGSDE